MLRWNRSKVQDTAATRGAEEAVASDAIKPPNAPPASQAPEAEVQRISVTLPQLLLSEGRATEEQLRLVLEKQKETGAFIGELLIEQGILDEQSLLSFLAKHCKIPHLSLLDYLIEPDILGLIPEETCLRYRLIPIDKLGRNLTVAMVNPLDVEALQKVREYCPDLRIKPILCAFNHFETVTAKLFKSGQKPGSPVDLTASSFGLTRPGPKKPAATAAAPTAVEPAPPPTEEADLPDAPEFEDASTPALEPEPESKPEREPESTPKPDSTPAPESTAAPEAASEQVTIPPAPEDLEVQDSMLDQIFQPREESAEMGVLGAVGGGDASSLMQQMANVMMDSMRDTYSMLARRMALFSGIPAEDVAKIFSRGMTREFEAEQEVFAKGEAGDELFIILGGDILIHDGEREMARLGRGDTFGEMALVSNAPRSASATALSSASLLTLNMDIIAHVMPRDVSIQLLVNIVITLSERLRNANEQATA